MINPKAIKNRFFDERKNEFMGVVQYRVLMYIYANEAVDYKKTSIVDALLGFCPST